MSTMHSRVLRYVMSLIVLLSSSSSVRAAETASMYVCDSGIAFVDYTQLTNTNSRLTIGCTTAGKLQVVYAFTDASACPSENRTFETLRAWKATAEAALLSARTVHIYSTTCEDLDLITTVSLRAQ